MRRVRADVDAWMEKNRRNGCELQPAPATAIVMAPRLR